MMARTHDPVAAVIGAAIAKVAGQLLSELGSDLNVVVIVRHVDGAQCVGGNVDPHHMPDFLRLVAEGQSDPDYHEMRDGDGKLVSGAKS